MPPPYAHLGAGVVDPWAAGLDVAARRRLAPLRRVGEQSVALAGRQMENFGGRFGSVVARDGRTVVRATVAVGSTDVDGPRFPVTRPTKCQVRVVTVEAGATS